MKIYIHKRITTKHKNITENDVLTAWKNCSHYRIRTDKEQEEYIALGTDTKGRLIQMVGVLIDKDLLIYHALTPPTKKFLKEMGL